MTGRPPLPRPPWGRSYRSRAPPDPRPRAGGQVLTPGPCRPVPAALRPPVSAGGRPVLAAVWSHRESWAARAGCGARAGRSASVDNHADALVRWWCVSNGLGMTPDPFP